MEFGVSCPFSRIEVNSGPWKTPKSSSESESAISLMSTQVLCRCTRVVAVTPSPLSLPTITILCSFPVAPRTLLSLCEGFLRFVSIPSPPVYCCRRPLPFVSRLIRAIAFSVRYWALFHEIETGVRTSIVAALLIESATAVQRGHQSSSRNGASSFAMSMITLFIESSTATTTPASTRLETGVGPMTISSPSERSRSDC